MLRRLVCDTVNDASVQEYMFSRPAVFAHIACYLKFTADTLLGVLLTVTTRPSANKDGHNCIKTAVCKGKKKTTRAVTSNGSSMSSKGVKSEMLLQDLVGEADEMLLYVQDICNIGVEMYIGCLAERLLIYCYFPLLGEFSSSRKREEGTRCTELSL